MDQMRYEVENPEIKAKLQEMGHKIGKNLEGTNHGFVLLIFTFGEGGDMFYISNAQRQDMVPALEELIMKLEEK